MAARRLSQAEIDAATDQRGIIAPDVAALIRQTRVAEWYPRYDSVVVGEGAGNISRGWFNNWNDFSSGDQLTLFAGREGNVGAAYTNQKGPDLDFAQDLFETTIEFVVPTAIGDAEDNQTDTGWMQYVFGELLPQHMAVRIIMSDADEIIRAPAVHFPASTGSANKVIVDQASPTWNAGSNGATVIQNSWKWPTSIMVASKSKIITELSIDTPLRALFQNVTGPGGKIMPNGAGGTYRLPNWYFIRMTHRGPRYVQIRGARSSA